MGFQNASYLTPLWGCVHAIRKRVRYIANVIKCRQLKRGDLCTISLSSQRPKTTRFPSGYLEVSVGLNTALPKNNLMARKISDGVVHIVPEDLRKALFSDKVALEKWEDITPLARNEWICWVTFFKKPETRKEHVRRTVTELKEGMRRPCCWIGCIHRTDKPVSPSVQGILDRKSKKT